MIIPALPEGMYTDCTVIHSDQGRVLVKVGEEVFMSSTRDINIATAKRCSLRLRRNIALLKGVPLKAINDSVTAAREEDRLARARKRIEQLRADAAEFGYTLEVRK